MHPHGRRSHQQKVGQTTPRSQPTTGSPAANNGEGQGVGGPRRLAEQAEEMALQLECAKLTDEELPLGLAYKRFLDLVHRVISFAHGTLLVTEWGSGRLIPVAVRGNRVDLADQIRFARGSGLSAWVAQEGRAVVIPDPSDSVDRSPFADEALRAFLAFPLIQNGVVAGVVALARGDRAFSEEEFSRLGRLSEPLAATLSRLRREARLRELIYLDGQTGLSNHHHFLARIEEELQHTRQHATEFAIALVELAGFEEAARLLGRQMSARLLQMFTRRLQSSIRTCDMVASLDDGRFGLLLAGVNKDVAAGIVARITEKVLDDNLEIPRQQVALRLRAGLVAVAGGDHSAESVLQQAGAALKDIS